MLGGDRWQSVALGSSLVGGLSSVALSCTPVWCWTMWAPINFFPCFTRVFTFTCVYNICYLQWFFKIICLIISFFRSPVELVGHIFSITDKYLLCILPTCVFSVRWGVIGFIALIRCVCCLTVSVPVIVSPAMPDHITWQLLIAFTWIVSYPLAWPCESKHDKENSTINWF